MNTGLYRRKMKIVLQERFNVEFPPNELSTLLLEELIAARLGFSLIGDKIVRKEKVLQYIRASESRPSGKEFYHSDEWREVRYRALKLHGGFCQCCGARPSPGHPLHVDHIKPRSKYPELELELNNLQVLCEDCNLGKRAWDETDWRNVVPIRCA